MVFGLEYSVHRDGFSGTRLSSNSAVSESFFDFRSSAWVWVNVCPRARGALCERPHAHTRCTPRARTHARTWHTLRLLIRRTPCVFSLTSFASDIFSLVGFCCDQSHSPSSIIDLDTEDRRTRPSSFFGSKDRCEHRTKYGKGWSDFFEDGRVFSKIQRGVYDFLGPKNEEPPIFELWKRKNV